MILQTENLTKYYGNFRALDHFSISMDEGSIVGFVGPNGAGKTTAMRIISTLMRPTSGEVYINGVPLSGNLAYARKTVGYVPDFFGVYSAMNVLEYMEFYAEVNKVPLTGRKKLISDLLELVNLSDKVSSDVNKLSRGMKQRLCLCRSLLHDPKLLILDEPASGLDPQSRADLKVILKLLRSQGKSVLISSHILPELGEFCDHVIIMNRGVKVADGTLEEISKAMGEQQKISYTLLREEQMQDAVSIIKMNQFCGDVFRNGMTLEVEFFGTDEAAAYLLKRLTGENILISGVGKTEHSLEQIFLEVIDNENQKR